MATPYEKFAARLTRFLERDQAPGEPSAVIALALTDQDDADVTVATLTDRDLERLAAVLEAPHPAGEVSSR